MTRDHAGRYVCPDCGEAHGEPGFCPHHGVPLEPTRDALLGRAVGSYRLTRVLGLGATGRVYLAVHPRIGSRVAVKVLLPHANTDARMVQRFENEARLAAKIRHEGIIEVFDLSRIDDRPCIVMEYLDGAPLSDLIRDAGATMPVIKAVRLASDVLDALDAVHRAGIIHRDLKPPNIYVTARGRIKLLDFGVAKLHGTPPDGAPMTITGDGAIVGTPDYLSPEQVTSGPVDHRGDLYSMGAILFHCLTGMRPFVSDSLFELLHLHVNVPAPQASAFRPEVEPALDDVVARALEKLPDRRFDSARQMDDALRSSIGQSPRRAARDVSAPPRRSLEAMAGSDHTRRRGLGQMGYKDGKLNGFWTYWDDAGALVQVEEYRDGALTRTIDYRNGKPIGAAPEPSAGGGLEDRGDPS